MINVNRTHLYIRGEWGLHMARLIKDLELVIFELNWLVDGADPGSALPIAECMVWYLNEYLRSKHKCLFSHPTKQASVDYGSA